MDAGSQDQDHDHDHDHEEHSELDPMDVRVRALQTVLTEKGYIDPAALDVIVDTYQTRASPRHSSQVSTVLVGDRRPFGGAVPCRAV